jgi:peptidoglycan/xylan/chitin deacetylase (PgdA/CDA1 family)
MGYSIVNWTASGDDWQGDPAAVVTQCVLRDLQPGGVVLLHDGLEPPPHQAQWQPADHALRDRSPTIEALPMIIEPLRSQGYKFVTLPEMIRTWPPDRRCWFD